MPILRQRREPMRLRLVLQADPEELRHPRPPMLCSIPLKPPGGRAVHLEPAHRDQRLARRRGGMR